MLNAFSPLISAANVGFLSLDRLDAVLTILISVELVTKSILIPVPATKILLRNLLPSALTCKIALGLYVLGASLSLKKLNPAPKPNNV